MVGPSFRDASPAGSTEDGWLKDRAKLLSHRARGFGYPEATPEAVRHALRSGIGYLEFDTRVAGDGVLHAHHGTRIFTPGGIPKIAIVSEATLANQGVAKLADLLKVAAETIQPSQHICIDIKDFGHEPQHLDLIHHFSLGPQTIFVSWIPQSLTRLHAIAPEFPLILSYLNLLFLPFGAPLIEAILGDRELRVLDHVVLGPRAVERPLRHTTGFQHALLSRALPASMINVLRASNGGICVPTWCVCDELDAWCARQSLRQWVFTANDLKTYEGLRKRPQIEVIFSDDPLRVAG